MPDGKVVRKFYLYEDVSTYQHQLDNGNYETRPANLAGAIRHIETLPRDEQRDPNGFFSVEGGESNVSLRVFVDEENYIAGLFGKRRVYGLPTMENSSGLIYRLATEDDRDGVYEGAHFVYFVEERKLFLERSQYTPRKTTFQLFINEKLNGHESIHIENTFFKSVSRNNVSELLSRYGEITDLEVDIDYGYIEEIKEYDGRLGSALENLKELIPEGQQFRFGGGVKKYQRVGGMEDAKSFILDLLSNVPEAVKRAVAKVKFENKRRGRAVPINLLTEEAGYPVVIPTDKNRVVDSGAVWALMLNIFERIQSGEDIQLESGEESSDKAI